MCMEQPLPAVLTIAETRAQAHAERRGELVLHKFTCGTDGGSPVTGVVLDEALAISTAQLFMEKNSGGVLFKITSAGKFSVLHQFGGSCGQIRGCYYTLNGTDGKTPLYATVN